MLGAARLWCSGPTVLVGPWFPNNWRTTSWAVRDGRRHLRRHRRLRHRWLFLVSQVKTRIFFEKTDFICSSASPVGWWLSYDSSSFSYVDDLCLVLLYDTRISLGLHCSSTSTAAYLKFITAPCSSARGLFQLPAWLCASELREAPGPPGGCAGFYRPVPFPHPPPPAQFLQTQLWLRKRLRLTHCLLNA